MADKEYNGWANYETWNAALWMDNDEGSYRYWREAAQEAYDEAEADKTFTREERAALELSRRMKDEHEETMPDLGASMWSDLLSAAFSEINWSEIAEHHIAEVDKGEQEGEDDTEEE